MNIDWAALFKVAGVSFVFGVGIVCVFSLGLLSLNETAPAETGRAVTGPGRRALAGLCFAVCAAAVLYGLWLIVPQFH
jgi:hypothetical protein